MDIDFHAHILPKCDHGSDSLQTSLKQLKLAENAGIDVICATPHFYPQKENLRPFLERRAHGYECIEPYINGTVQRVLLGAEVLICDNLEKMDGLECLCLEGTNLLLLEMPFSPWTSRNFHTVQAILERETVQIVLAHIERYDKNNVSALLQMGAKAQVNASSICSLRASHNLNSFISKGQVFAVGSDIHALSGYEHWGKCRKKFGRNWNDLMLNIEKQL